MFCCCCCCASERLFIVVVMPSKLGARVEFAFRLDGPILPMPIMLPILARPAPGSSLIMCASEPFGSRMLYCAIERIFLVTHPARILPRCFSPSRDRWKSPFCTKETISMTSWCSFRMALTITGTMLARKLRRKISTTMTTRPPAWNTALYHVSRSKKATNEGKRTNHQEQYSGDSAPRTAQCPSRSDSAR